MFVVSCEKITTKEGVEEIRGSKILIDREKWDIHAIYLPEKDIDFDLECDRLKKIMDKDKPKEEPKPSLLSKNDREA